MTPSAVAKLVEKWREYAMKMRHGKDILVEPSSKELVDLQIEMAERFLADLAALATAPPEQAVVTVSSGNTTISSGMAKDLDELGPTAVNSAATGADEYVGPASGVRNNLKEFIADKVMAAAVKGYETGWKHRGADQPQAVSAGARAFVQELRYVLEAEDGITTEQRDARLWGILVGLEQALKATPIIHGQAALAAHDQKVRENVAREHLAMWMIEHSFATGHGDTFEELLKEFAWQFMERQEALFAKENTAIHDQKVRREVLEEAAQLAEGMNVVSAMHSDGLRDPRIVALDIAKGIRDLAAPAASKPAGEVK